MDTFRDVILVRGKHVTHTGNYRHIIILVLFVIHFMVPVVYSGAQPQVLSGTFI